MNRSKKVIFLYTELADYFLSTASIVQLQAEVKIVHWPIAKEAPFDFSKYQHLSLINREGLHLEALKHIIHEFDPDVIICSGWIDKDYLKVTKSFFGKIPTVLTLDNHWKGGIKQQVATIISPFTIRKTFSHAWVPGNAQRKYALKLGFYHEDISTGFYCANTHPFQQLYKERRNPTGFSKRFLYVGRYVKHKGIFDLWSAFEHYRKQGGDWELVCVGTGDQWENRVESEGITHLGFKQPDELMEVLKEGGIYVLPSHIEPWGVSVHEMAAAGFPMLLSHQIGSKEAFLEDGKNGFSFAAGEVHSLLNRMTEITKLDQGQIQKMGEHSHELSGRISQEQWVETVLNWVK